MTHPRDVVEKYLSDPVIGVVGSGKADMVRGAAFDDEPGVLLVNVRSHEDACCLLILSIIYEICATIFSAKKLKISNDRSGLTRSAVCLIFVIVVHAVGHLHVFKVRFRWSVSGLSCSVPFPCFFFCSVFVFCMTPRDLTISTGTGISTSGCIGQASVSSRTSSRITCFERFVAHRRRFETNFGSEAVFCVGERPSEFGHHWIDVAHVHDHSPLPVPFR